MFSVVLVCQPLRHTYWKNAIYTFHFWQATVYARLQHSIPSVRTFGTNPFAFYLYVYRVDFKRVLVIKNILSLNPIIQMI